MGAHRRSWFAGGLLVLALLVTFLTPASSFTTGGSDAGESPAAQLVEPRFVQATMGSGADAVRATRDRLLTRFLRLVPSILAVGAALFGPSLAPRARRRRRAVSPPLLFASGVPRRGPPPVG